MSRKLLACLTSIVLAFGLLPSAYAAIPAPVHPDFFSWTNVQNWSSSYALKTNASWSTILVPERNWTYYYGIGEQPTTQLIDVNGDGATDLVSINHTSETYWPSGSTGTGTPIYYTVMRDMVKLNNGAGGYTIAYACYNTVDNVAKKIKYYGDCANTSSSTPPTVNPTLLTTSGSSLFQSNLSTLPTSTTANFSAPYSTLSLPNRAYETYRMIGEMPTRTFTDVNGDGLMDLVYIDHVLANNGGGAYTIKDATLLNTGSGWVKAYQCYAYTSTSSGPFTYYGDCAL